MAAFILITVGASGASEPTPEVIPAVIEEPEVDELLLARDLETMGLASSAASLIRKGDNERAIRVLEHYLSSSLSSANERVNQGTRLRTGELPSLRQTSARTKKYAEAHGLSVMAAQAANLNTKLNSGQTADAGAVDRASDAEKKFHAFLDAIDASQLELRNGRPEAIKALWSKRADATLAGGFGGAIEKGPDAIAKRLDWVATQYSNGTHSHERIVADMSGNFGYVVQREQIRFRVPGQEPESTRDFRVSMVFRNEPNGWRLVHRHADAQTTKQASK